MFDSVSMLLATALVAFVILHPDEAMDAWEDIRIGFLIWQLNRVMQLRAWIMYCRLKRDFEAAGMSMPPFKYVPLQERNLD